MRIHCLAWLLPLALACAPAAAREAPPAKPPLALKTTARLDPAPLQGGGFTLKARLAREESVGELRENSGFALIGRLAPADASCAGDLIFANGFDGG